MSSQVKSDQAKPNECSLLLRLSPFSRQARNKSRMKERQVQVVWSREKVASWQTDAVSFAAAAANHRASLVQVGYGRGAAHEVQFSMPGIRVYNRIRLYKQGAEGRG